MRHTSLIFAAQSVMPSAVRVAAVLLLAVWVGQSQSTQTGSASPSESRPKPLLLEKNEGEQRIWRDPPPGAFMLKVSPENNGSQHLVLLTEDLQPGDTIPRHQHLGQDEILFIEAGKAHVQVGDQRRDLNAGGLVFIPAYTWVSLRNNSNAPVSIVGIFSAPGFEKHLRCVSVLANEKAIPLSPDEKIQCDHEGHVTYQELGQNSDK
jgi:quercetin dioxygenase-like cupin family protein